MRVSHSGDGCGAHWPDCQGVLVPVSVPSSSALWIEWIHRALSGLFGLAVLGLLGLSFLVFPKGHGARKTCVWVLCLTLIEAAIGAVLVLTGLTGGNKSWSRAGVMSFHLLNSLLLSAGLFVCYRLSLGRSFNFFKLLGGGGKGFGYLFIFCVIAVLGALAALSSSLFPSSALWAGWLLDFDSHSHWLIRLRVWHPLAGLIFGGGFLYSLCYFRGLSPGLKMPSPGLKEHGFPRLLGSSFWLGGALAGVLLSGVLNLVLLSPVILKMLHLLFIHLLVFAFLLTLETPFRKSV